MKKISIVVEKEEEKEVPQLGIALEKKCNMYDSCVKGIENLFF